MLLVGILLDSLLSPPNSFQRMGLVRHKFQDTVEMLNTLFRILDYTCEPQPCLVIFLDLVPEKRAIAALQELAFPSEQPLPRPEKDPGLHAAQSPLPQKSVQGHLPEWMVDSYTLFENRYC